MENFYDLIRKKTFEISNDMELGKNIRSLVLQIEQDRTNNLNAAKRTSKQIDLEDMINEIKNAD